MDMLKDAEIARLNHPLQCCTPSPDPELNPQDSTPNPTSHWVFLVKVQHIIERKWTGNTSMEAYDGKPARPVPITKQTLTPQEGKICVRTWERNTCPEKISINPRYLVPWKSLVSREAVITCGFWSGFVGAIKGQQGVDRVVMFMVDNDAHDTVFVERELAALEPLK
ncbi:hypothetical protein EI94DRAFT_1740890 [Lactarius quietus]|nr:hypothetical protein EI94DRAFT_1740890 [Lactarius quietus]